MIFLFRFSSTIFIQKTWAKSGFIKYYILTLENLLKCRLPPDSDKVSYAVNLLDNLSTERVNRFDPRNLLSGYRSLTL